MSQISESSRDLLHKELIQLQIVKSCLNCEHFVDDSGECAQFQYVKPPPKVVVFSCGKNWENRCPF